MSDTAKNAADFVRYILEQLCDHKDKITVDANKDDLGILVTVTVAEEDMGKLIGKQGQTIGSLRTLVRIIGARDGERVNLKVLEPSEA